MAIIQDPNTGLFIDNTTGKTYKDANGLVPSDNPQLTAQAQRNLQVANELFARLGGDQERYRQVFQRQSELARSLDQQIRGTAPSVAQTQLTEGTDQIRQQAESMASGASGAAAPLARYTAIQTAGDASAKANQAAAELRANEVQQATQTKAAVLGQQANEANTASGVNVAGMNAAEGAAVTPQATQAQIDQREKERLQNFYTSLINGAGSGLVTAGARA